MYSRHKPKEKSAIIFILKALVPYTEANMMLAFKPSRFFTELERISEYKRRSLENAFYQAQRQEFIKFKLQKDLKILEITKNGQRLIRPFVAEKFSRGGKLMIVFDIPEEMSASRNRLRRVLKSWNFYQVQKSVWVTEYDHRQS